MHEFRQIKPLETMERITRQQFCDNLDEILDRVNQEDIGFVILNAEGKDGHVLCPARWFQIDLGDDFGCMHDSFDAALGGVVNGALRYAISDASLDLPGEFRRNAHFGGLLFG